MINVDNVDTTWVIGFTKVKWFKCIP